VIRSSVGPSRDIDLYVELIDSDIVAYAAY